MKHGAPCGSSIVSMLGKLKRQEGGRQKTNSSELEKVRIARVHALGLATTVALHQLKLFGRMKLLRSKHQLPLPLGERESRLTSP